MAKEKISGIYKVTNPIGQIYIGKSKHLLNRWQKTGYNRCEKMFNSISEHGFKNHTFEIIEKCSIDLLNEREKYWIRFYDTFDTPHGLNLQDGGENCKIADQTRKKQSQKKIGYKRSPETVSFNFNYNQVIGHAFLIETADGIYADIVISEPFALRTVACPSLFPYLGGEVDRDSKLFTAKDVAIGIYPNEDETISMISPNQIQI